MPAPAAAIPPLALFDHNWDAVISLASAWHTDSVVALAASEARRGGSDKPTRVMKAKGLTLAAGQAGAFKVQISRSTGGRMYMPLFCDGVIVSGGPTVVTCDTTTRRFFAGHRVIIVTFDRDKRATNIHVTLADAVTSTTVTLHDALPFALTPWTAIYPAIEADTEVDIRGDLATDRSVIFDITCRERAGASAIPALATAESLPAGEPTYAGLPVLTIPHDWEAAQEGESRHATVSAVGLDSIADIYGPTSLIVGQLRFLQLNRADAFRLLRFFDTRCGSLFAFWLPGQTEDLTVSARTSGTVWLVDKSITAADLLARGYLAFWATDGTVLVRKIVSVTDTGPALSVVVDLSVATLLTGLLRLSFASLAHFDTDSLEESWSTDGALTATLKLAGLRANSCGTGEIGDSGCDADFPIIPDPTTSDDPELPWEPVECSALGVSVPMFFDSTQALNSWKEPIRAADLNIPTSVRVKFKNTLVQDTTRWATPLSAELLSALFREHNLDYVGPLAAPHSRNPYHIRLKGVPGDPGFGFYATTAPGLAVTRHLYQKTIPYTVGVTVRTLDVRVVVEYTDSRTDGLWGALVVGQAFADEVNPSYVDGATFSYGGHSGTYTHGDPYVWGPYFGAGEPTKYAHPQALLVFHLATTLHAPVGSSWVPKDRTRFAPCYKVANGTPWTSGTAANAGLNSVFGTVIGAYNMAGMTLGGGLSSEIIQWACIENGRGEGITALKPARAGWDETLGDLTPELGNDVSVLFCNPGQSGNTINACDGHPLEPFEGVGGTHRCFRDEGDPDQFLCVPILVAPVLGINEACITTTAEYGAWNGSECPLLSEHCESHIVATMFTLVLWDYTYNMGGSASSRKIEWRAWVDDPDYLRINWVYVNPASLTSWSAVLGSWSIASEFQCTATTGGSGLSAYLAFRFGESLLEDSSIQTLSKATTASVGLAVRMTGTSSKSGYLGVYFRSTGISRIYLLVANVLTILVETHGPIYTSGDIDMSLTIDGAHITFGWIAHDHSGPAGNAAVDDCTIQTAGDTGIVLFGATASARFDNTLVFDQNWRKAEAHAALNGDGSITADADSRIGNIYLSHGCTGDTVGCPGPTTCPCTSISHSIVGAYALSTGMGSPPVGPYGGGNPDPTCGLPSACPPAPPCGECPPPFAAMSLAFPPSCENVAHRSSNIYKPGVEIWSIDYVVCV